MRSLQFYQKSHSLHPHLKAENASNSLKNYYQNYVKSKFAVAVNSGTAALQASLYAIDIKPGDEVLASHHLLLLPRQIQLSLLEPNQFLSIF